MTHCVADHCLQYAIVGGAVVIGTESMNDVEVLVHTRLNPIALGVERSASVERFNRCIECEVWTTAGGKLRTNLQCPAVKDAIAKQQEFGESLGDGSGQRPAACVDYKAFTAQRVRESLAVSRSRYQRAVATFPLQVARVAADLLKLCDMVDAGVSLSADERAVMDKMETMIRECFCDTFGVELGQ